MKQKFTAQVGQKEIVFDFEKKSDGRAVLTRDGQNFSFVLERLGDSHYLVLEDNGRVHHIGLTQRAEEWTVHLDGELLHFSLVDEKTQLRKNLSGAALAGGGGTLVTPMPGRVVKVLVQVGDQVVVGQPVVVVEAMKMENEFKAGKDGTIAEICVTAGQTLESGAVLLKIS